MAGPYLHGFPFRRFADCGFTSLPGIVSAIRCMRAIPLCIGRERTRRHRSSAPDIMKIFLTAVLVCAAYTRVCGGVLLSESFSYPDGVLTNVSAGKWRHSSGGFAEVNVEGERVELTGAESEDVEASLSASFSSSSGAILYAK